MQVDFAGFQWSPEGHSSQDRYTVVLGSGPLVRAVIADGAGTFYRSDELASALCRSALFADGISRRDFEKTVDEATEAFTESCRPLPSDPWWARKQFRERGSGSTLLALEILPEEWRARAVGDSNLFQISGSKRRGWPYWHSEGFPQLAPLVHTRLEHENGPVLSSRGRFDQGDVFMLATDTLAKGLMRLDECGVSPWSALRSIKRQEQFDAVVEQLYERLPDHKRDDLTLVRLEVS